MPKVISEEVMRNDHQTLTKFVVVADGVSPRDVTAAARMLMNAINEYTSTIGVAYNGFFGHDNPFVYLVIRDNR